MCSTDLSPVTDMQRASCMLPRQIVMATNDGVEAVCMIAYVRCMYFVEKVTQAFIEPKRGVDPGEGRETIAMPLFLTAKMREEGEGGQEGANHVLPTQIKPWVSRTSCLTAGKLQLVAMLATRKG